MNGLYLDTLRRRFFGCDRDAQERMLTELLIIRDIAVGMTAGAAGCGRENAEALLDQTIARIKRQFDVGLPVR